MRDSCCEEVLTGTDMKKLLFAALLSSIASAARADVIFTNLTSAYQSTGLSVVSSGTDFSLAYSFVVTGHSFQLTQLDFATYFSNTGGTNEISATLYADNGGTPGLPSGTPGTLPIGGTGQVDPAGQVYTTGVLNGVIGSEVMQTVMNGPILNVGQTYWLSLDGPTDASVSWNYAGPGSVGVNGAAAYYNGSSWVSYGSKLQGAFELDGTVVAPEPVSIGLFASGFAALIAFRRKQKLS